MMLSSLNFCLSGKLLISLSNLNEILVVLSILCLALKTWPNPPEPIGVNSVKSLTNLEREMLLLF